MKIQVTETSGATFTSYAPYEATIQDFVTKLSIEQVSDLETGKTVVLITYNLAGTMTKRVLKAI